MKFSITDFFSKRGQIRSFLRIWSHLLKKSVIENFIFLYGVKTVIQSRSRTSKPTRNLVTLLNELEGFFSKDVKMFNEFSEQCLAF